LRVTGEPAGAAVKVTGPGGFKDDGGLPWEAEGLRSGSYHVDVSRAGYATDARDVEVGPGQTATAAVKLPKEDAGGGTSTGAAGIVWVSIPGGSFDMGSNDNSDEKPVHRVTVRGFRMSKTEVTFGQYRKCVDAGKCTAPHVSDGSCYVYTGSSWEMGTLPSSFQGADQPVVCVHWNQAVAFATWAGGRLPTEAEWEYAARSGGRAQRYPWGSQKATCDREVMGLEFKCGDNGTRPETLMDTYVMFDVSSVFGRKKGAIFVGPGFEFWNNKFGGANYTNTNPATPFNNNQPVHAFMAQAEIHF